MCPEKDLNARGGPYRDAGSEEIRILRPDTTGQGERGGKHRPIFFIAAAQAQSSFRFKHGIEIRGNGFDHGLQVFERVGKTNLGFVALLQDEGEILASIREGNVRSKKSERPELSKSQ